MGCSNFVWRRFGYDWLIYKLKMGVVGISKLMFAKHRTFYGQITSARTSNHFHYGIDFAAAGGNRLDHP